MWSAHDAIKAVLITGCSTGIGRATAIAFAQAGWPTYATARRVESISDLESYGCLTLPLDVTDTESIQSAVDTVKKAHGSVGVLVNNAGYALHAALESLPVDAVRRQFETNVFGSLEVTNRVLPAMREHGSGRIFFVGSTAVPQRFPAVVRTAPPSTPSKRSATLCDSRYANSGYASFL